MCFLVKRGKTYHLHVKVPPELAPVLGTGDLSVSLKTNSSGKANKMSALVSRRFDVAFRKIRSKGKEVAMEMETGELTRAEIRKLVRDYVKSDLETFELEQATGRPGNHGTVDDDLEAIDTALDQSKMALAMRRHREFMEVPLENLLADAGLPKIDQNTVTYQVLTRELLKASIRVLEAQMGLLVGNPQGHDLGTILKDLGISGEAEPSGVETVETATVETVEPTVETVEPDRPRDSASPTLGAVVDEFQRRKVESGQWRPTTVRNHQPKLNALLQVLGHDRPVDSITIQDAREYAQLLELLPPAFALKGYKDLTGVTVGELKDKAHSSTLDVTTRREYLNLAKSLFQFALDNEYVAKNPIISGLIPAKKGNQRAQRLPFDQEDLNRIFDPETFGKWTADSPARYWIPKLALFTGSRLEELANLNCADVFKHEESGLWCIDHNMDNGRRLKNQNSIRTIPLHPMLGKEFAEYVARVRAQGHDRVFPELNKANSKYSHNFSKAFGNYLRNKVKIADRRKTFHSFRHTVTDCLYKQMVQESIIEELTGRAGKTETRKRYAKGYRVETLYQECILKLDFEIPLEAMPL